MTNWIRWLYPIIRIEYTTTKKHQTSQTRRQSPYSIEHIKRRISFNSISLWFVRRWIETEKKLLFNIQWNIYYGIWTTGVGINDYFSFPFYFYQTISCKAHKHSALTLELISKLKCWVATLIIFHKFDCHWIGRFETKSHYWITIPTIQKKKAHWTLTMLFAIRWSIELFAL